MLDIRRSRDRGPSRFGWLESRHSFSFGSYYDPEHMGVSALRVLNDDRVVPGAGFPQHSHHDMEIITYVLSGVIEHKDSIGNIETLAAGEFQLMSAGTGITHSEYNPSQTDALHFLQIWVVPDEFGIQPEYQQKKFGRDVDRQLVVSPDGRAGSLKIHQDAIVERLLLAQGEEVGVIVPGDRVNYLHMISGGLTIDEDQMQAGDGATIDSCEAVLRADEDTELLLFNLPDAKVRFGG